MATIKNVKLTKKAIEEIPPPTKNRDYYMDADITGLGVCVTTKGTKSWFLQKTVNGQTKRITLGNALSMVRTTAKEKARDLRADIDKGADPITDKRARATKRRNDALTLHGLLKEYSEARSHVLKQSTISDYERSLKQFCPDWLDTPINLVTSVKIADQYKARAKTAPYVADRGRRVLNAIFQYHMGRYKDESGEPLLKRNPVQAIREQRLTIKPQRKDRIIDPEDLSEWSRLAFELCSRNYAALLHFSLFCATRFDATAALTWDNIDVKKWILYLDDTKNRNKEKLPIPKPIRFLIRDMKTANPGSNLLFPAKNGNPFKNSGYYYEKLKKHFKRGFSPHDLKRTFISTAEEVGIGLFAQKRLAQHITSNDVTGGYVVLSLDQLRQAQAKVTDLIAKRIGGRFAEEAQSKNEGETESILAGLSPQEIEHLVKLVKNRNFTSDQ